MRALHSRGYQPKGSKIRSGRLTLAFSGGQKRVEMLCHPCILGDPQCQARRTKSEVAATPSLIRGPKEGGNATSPLHSRGYPTKGNKIRSGCLTPAFSGTQKRAEMLCHPCSPKAKRGEQNQKWLPHACLIGGPKEGGNATPPLQSRGSPTKRSKITSGCLSPAFSGGQKRAEMLRHTYILGDPKCQAPRTKSEVVATPCLIRGPKEGRKCYVTPAFSGIPNKGEQNQKWLPHACLLGGPKEGANATSPLHSRGYRTKGSKPEVDASPLPSQKPKRGRKCYATPAFSGIPNAKRGEKIGSGCHTLPYQGPKRGWKCYVTLAFSGIPNKGEQKQKWMPHPCLLGDPKEGGNATSPLQSQGSPKPSAGNKIRNGCLTSALSEAQKRAEMLRHPCILGYPQQRGAKSEMAASPLPSRGAKRGQKCYV